MMLAAVLRRSWGTKSTSAGFAIRSAAFRTAMWAPCLMLRPGDTHSPWIHHPTVISPVRIGPFHLALPGRNRYRPVDDVGWEAASRPTVDFGSPEGRQVVEDH